MSFEIPRYHGRQYASAPLGYFHGVPASFQEYFYELRFAGSQRVGAIATLVQYEYTHGHAQFGKGIAYFLLLFGWPVRHAIVFDGPESLVVGEFYLIDEVVTCAVAEHPVMNAVVEIEWLSGSSTFP